MAEMADSPPLRLGVEIEGLFVPHKEDPNKFKADLADQIAEGRTDVFSGFGSEEFKTLKWIIKADESIRGFGKNGPCK